MNNSTRIVRNILVVSRLAMVLALPAVLIACSDNKTANVTPPVAPVLNNPPDQSYARGVEITALSFANTGGQNLTACASAPELSDGLAVAVKEDKSTCEITGTPTEEAELTSYVITATNATGSSAGTIKIVTNATPPVAPVLNNPPDQSYARGVEITALSFANTGGQNLTACASAPELSDGLAVAVKEDKSTCEITGTPTEEAELTSYVITATNATGSSAGTVKIVTNIIFNVINSTGEVAPNNIAISTVERDASGQKLTDGEGETASENVSPKMTFTVDSTTGEVTVKIAEAPDKLAVFGTLFSTALDADPVVLRDMTGYEKGVVKFDIQSDAWGIYKTNNGFVAGLEHSGDSNNPSCGCLQFIDTFQWVDGSKYTVTIHIPKMIAEGQLDLTKISTGIILNPNQDLQVDLQAPAPFDAENPTAEETAAIAKAAEDDDDDRTITYKISNVRWESTGGTESEPTSELVSAAATQ